MTYCTPCVIITQKRNNTIVDIGAGDGRFMGAKDLLPQMLELRRRNLTYKQIAEELEVSPSIVGKMLKEVREKPELALEFIELTHFETGQTILSFTPEDFEKHRKLSTLYSRGLQLYEIREGLIHSTEFTEHYWVKSPPSSPISNWYGDLIKLYDGGVNWNESIVKFEHRNEIETFYGSKRFSLSMKRKLLEGLNHHIDNITMKDQPEIVPNQYNELVEFLIGVLMNNPIALLQRMNGLIQKPSEFHWLNNDDLMEQATKLQKEITEFAVAISDPKKAINYCLPLIYKELTIDELILDWDNGWDIEARGKQAHQIMSLYARFKELNISKETWDDMARLSIKDLDYYLLISPWLEFDGGKIKQLLEGEDGTVSQNPKLDWPVRTFSTRYHQYTDGIEAEDNKWNHKLSNWVLENIDGIIETAENLGWTLELVSGAIDLSEVFDIDLETVRQIGISNIQLATNSLKYCRQNGLGVNAGILPWFEEHEWKVPKLKKGFRSYVSKEIYDMISEEVKIQKLNYLDVNEINQLFMASKAPKRQFTNYWSVFIRSEINKEPFDSICFLWNNYLGIKPCTPELFQMFSDSKTPLELIKDSDITNVLSAIENLKESNVEINAEIIEWASQKQWDVSQLGQFETYRQRWLYHRLIEYEIPAVRMDKLLDEYNNSTEPGTNLDSELELHEVLQQSPFKELCTSSSDGGMIFFDKDASNSKVNSIIEEKIVVKNVVVEKKVYVEKDTISVQPLIDLEPYPLILKSDSDYAKRAVETIRKADLNGSINDVWRLLSIEAKILLEDEIDRESNFNVILVDKLCEKLSIDERQQKKIHQLRRARNDFDKGKSESPIKPNNSLVINGLETIEKIMSL